MTQDNFGLFGPSPEELRMAMQQQRDLETQRFAGLDPYRQLSEMAGSTGGMFNDALKSAFNVQDPGMKKAQDMKAIQDEIAKSGIDNELDMFKAAAMKLRERGYMKEAMQAATAYQKLAYEQSRQKKEEALAERALMPKEQQKYLNTPLGIFDTESGEYVKTESGKRIKHLGRGWFQEEGTSNVFQNPDMASSFVKPSGGTSGAKATAKQSMKAEQEKEGSNLMADTAIRKIDAATSGIYDEQGHYNPKNSNDAFKMNFGGYNALVTSRWPGAANTYRVQLESLKANMKSAGLALIRMSGSPGAITEKEWPIFEQMIDSINPQLNEAEAAKAFKEIKNFMLKWKEIANKKGGDVQSEISQQEETPDSIKTAEDFLRKKGKR